MSTDTSKEQADDKLPLPPDRLRAPYYNTLRDRVTELENRTCVWEESFYEDGMSACETACGNVYEDTDHSNPCPHAWVYCPACGGKIESKPETDDDDTI